MGFKWGDAGRGAWNGFKAGSKFGPVGMVVGTVAGGAAGGYAKDIDKKLTGNSQSSTVEDSLDMAGSFGSLGSLGSAGNLFNRFNSRKKVEPGYENNPAVIDRANNSDFGDGIDLSSIMNLFNRGGSDSLPKGSRFSY